MDTLEYIQKTDPNAETFHFKKGEMVQRGGDARPRAYYVRKGLIRSYIIDGKGKEHIFDFAPENWIIADLESIEFHQPVELFIDCIEDSEVTVINQHALMEGDPSRDLVNNGFRLMFRRMGMLQRRIVMQLSASAAERYTHFLATYPNLPNRVPQHMIASYLGITPQALSTIRNKISHHDPDN